jgi:xanthine phosphoribosyltransferase
MQIEMPRVRWETLPKNPEGFREWFTGWERYHFDGRIAVHKAHALQQEEGFEWAGLIMIPRGAGIVQTIAGRELNIRDKIETLCIKSYDIASRKPPEVTKKIGAGFLESLDLGPKRRLLLVDDLTDEGGTMMTAADEIGPELMRWTLRLTIYAKPAGMSTLDFWGLEVPQDVWIRQPFDTEWAYAHPISGGTE